MLVLKFGGTSVGTVDSLRQVSRIVARSRRPLVVVVSALGGVTDRLVRMTEQASKGDDGYLVEMNELISRHAEIIPTLVSPRLRAALTTRIDGLWNELRSILRGAFLIQDMTPKTADAIVSYGERLSSLIVAAILDTTCIDSRRFIKTYRRGDKHLVAFDETNKLIREMVKPEAGSIVVPGFIAADLESGVTTNLGRGGSDYTAALLAAALEAEALEIWTDVSGFMTADPRLIPSAFPIPELSYAEAMELCNFGAKVVYPPTIYPVCRKDIPIYIKNTFRPDDPGSVIRNGALPSERPVRGLSSVNEMSMVTVSGPAMVGVIGVNRRIFTTLAAGGISVFMVAQNSSETCTSICMTPASARRACELLDSEFESEIASGAMVRATLSEGLASVAVVGERMRRRPGIAGRLFSVLGRNGISISAVAMGGEELNLSFVVARDQLRKTLSVLHDSFFLSEHEDLNLFICGTGTVGGSLLRQIAAQRETLFRERGLRIRVCGVSGRTRAVFNEEGIDPATYREQLSEGESGGVERVIEEILRLNLPSSVFVDCTAGEEVAACYERLLSNNVNIVAANKIAASSSYERYARLKSLARERGVKFLFETNVGAGLPIIGTINDLCGSGDRVLRIEAVLSGTLNYVFNTLSAEIPFSRAVALAGENGYSEPDPRVDLSGRDVIRKLVILARESGYRVETSDVVSRPIIPNELFEGTLENFRCCLPMVDRDFERERLRLESEGRRLRFVASWENGRAEVGLREIPSDHPFYHLEGSNNIILLTTERYRDYPMLIQGYGAGADVTAAGVFADIMRVANV